MVCTSGQYPKHVVEQLIKERRVAVLINGLRAIITEILNRPLQIQLEGIAHSSHDLEYSVVLLQLLLYDSGGTLNQFLHLLDDPAIRVELLVLLQCLVLLVLQEGPDVVGELGHTLFQLDLSLRVLAQVRELLRELVVRVNEVLNESIHVGVLSCKVHVDELSLHLSEALEDVAPLFLDGSEDLEALAVVVELELLPQLHLHLVIQNDLLLRPVVQARQRTGASRHTPG